jgi:hypothetical protein
MSSLWVFSDQPTNSFPETFLSEFGDDHHFQDANEETETATHEIQKIAFQVKSEENLSQEFIRYELPKHLDHKDLTNGGRIQEK